MLINIGSTHQTTNRLQRRLLNDETYEPNIDVWNQDHSKYNNDDDEYNDKENERKTGWNTGYGENSGENDGNYKPDHHSYKPAEDHGGNQQQDYQNDNSYVHHENMHNHMDEYNDIHGQYNYQARSSSWNTESSYVKEAIVILNVGDDTDIEGYVKFEDIDNGEKTKISAKITGLKPGKHGWHIHEFGDLYTDGCASAGPHYNPFDNDHGAPNDEIRHIGDLGNIEADQDGVVCIEDQYDEIIKLNGPNSIIGRSFVVHSDEDDLGTGGDDESLQTGNAGDRLRCGVIGIKSED